MKIKKLLLYTYNTLLGVFSFVMIVSPLWVQELHNYFSEKKFYGSIFYQISFSKAWLIIIGAIIFIIFIKFNELKSLTIAGIKAEWREKVKKADELLAAMRKISILQAHAVSMSLICVEKPHLYSKPFYSLESREKIALNIISELKDHCSIDDNDESIVMHPFEMESLYRLIQQTANKVGKHIPLDDKIFLYKGLQRFNILDFIYHQITDQLFNENNPMPSDLNNILSETYAKIDSYYNKYPNDTTLKNIFLHKSALIKK